MPRRVVTVNRAPVLTLWAAVVAARLGFDWDAALTLGRGLAGLNAQSRGRRLGIHKPAVAAGTKPPKARPKPGEQIWVELCGRGVPALSTKDGIRAVAGDRAVDPASVTAYLEGKFGDDLEAVKEAMEALARSMGRSQLADRAFALYEEFRPAVPSGKKGWGAAGTLDLGKIRSLADSP
ncbi:MAG: hypothetical protein FJY74_06985 [Candidatus Eisenbacteria bacterium]|nr:hypothetical protein [Candidatus Eisenbacteria bacterium]